MNCYYNPVRTICDSGAIKNIPALLGSLIAPKGKVLLLTWNEKTICLEGFKELSEAFTLRTVSFDASNPTVEQLFELYRQTVDFCLCVIKKQ